MGSPDSIKVNVRIIAATNQNLEDLVHNGSFRSDLYFRLNVFPITIPPLRERVEDIPLLISHFIHKHEQRINRRVNGIAPDAMALLAAYNWPGNIRELENVIQRMMVVTKGEVLDFEDLPPQIRGQTSEAESYARKDLKEIVRESSGVVEKNVISDALSKNRGNVTRSAKSLGISRATLQKKMKLYGINRSTF